MPLASWFRRELKPELTGVLLDSRTLQRGYFNEKGVRALLKEHSSGRRDRSLELWILLVFELWHRNFLEARKTVSANHNVLLSSRRVHA